MRKKFRRSHSRAARWSPRFGAWAIIWLFVIIVCHRFDIIDTEIFLISMGLGLGLALGGLALAIKGFADLWSYGDKGGRASIKGVIVSLITLMPFMLAGTLWLVMPPFYDISSDPDNPPPYLAANRPHNALPPLADFHQQAELQQESWPDLSGRRYEISPDSIIKAIEAVIEENGWEEPNQINDLERFTAAGAKGKTALEDSEIFLTTIMRVPVLGFASDVVIRVRDEDEATLVDMRVTSRNLSHDFGFGAYSIISFMQALDREVLLSAIVRTEED